MAQDLFQLLNSVDSSPEVGDVDAAAYSVLAISKESDYFVGKDRDGNACFLISSSNSEQSAVSPIRLEYLEVEFHTRCMARRPEGSYSVRLFTVLRCRSSDSEIVRYFLLICDTLARTLGRKPRSVAVKTFVYRIASIFQRVHSPGARMVNGLFGELYLIARSSSPSKVLLTWRVDGLARFDFVDADFRLDVKTASGRVRRHMFSHDQCNPPRGTTAVVASMLVERVARGISLGSLIRDIERCVGDDPALVWKLHEVVADTLGSAFSAAMAFNFDEEVSRSSLRFFDIADVPAVRGEPPRDVSGITFYSDLSESRPIRNAHVATHHPTLGDFVPR